MTSLKTGVRLIRSCTKGGERIEGREWIEGIVRPLYEGVRPTIEKKHKKNKTTNINKHGGDNTANGLTDTVKQSMHFTYRLCAGEKNDGFTQGGEESLW